jgi:hypothetical protein
MPAIPFGTLTADFDEDRRNRIEEKKATIRAEMCTCRPILDEKSSPDCLVHGDWYDSPKRP